MPTRFYQLPQGSRNQEDKVTSPSPITDCQRMGLEGDSNAVGGTVCVYAELNPYSDLRAEGSPS